MALILRPFVFLCAGLLLATAGRASAQTLRDEPFSLADGRVVIGGDVSAGIAPADPGFFNYGTYEHNGLRELRLGIAARVRLGARLTVLAEIRSENFDDVRPSALYARFQPFTRARLHVQAGRIPPTFGRGSRTTYQRDNPLIGVPLAYQYLTSLRADALPADVDALLAMRARGWLASYTIGDRTPRAGMPLVSALRWDTGVQVTGSWRRMTVAGAITAGSLSNPRVHDDNGSKGLATRITVSATPGLELGASFARGGFVARRALRPLGLEASNEFVQTGYGLDAEYGRGHLTITAEAVATEWRLPLDGATQSLRALAGSLTARYALFPGMYLAGRLEHLAFNRVHGSSGSLAWDAPVTRLEIGGGYQLQRNLLARVAWQMNDRAAGRVLRDRFVAAQLLFWV